jgi:Beta-galactosidase
VEAILDNLQQRASCNMVYLIAVEIGHKRPITDDYYPHNPARKFNLVEEGRAYFRTHPEAYRETPVKPHPPRDESLVGTDWLEVLSQAARARGLRLGAEFSHGWHDPDDLETRCPEALQRDVFGNLLRRHLCFNSPPARRYALGLFADVCAHYDLDMVQTCVYLFNQGAFAPPHAHGVVWGEPRVSPEVVRLLGLVRSGGCFCPACGAAARRAGYDWDGIVEALGERARWLTRPSLAEAMELAKLLRGDTTGSSLLLEWPELYQFLRFRIDSVTDFFREAHEVVHRANPRTELRLNHYERFPELLGLDLTRLAPHLDSVRNSDYTEQLGRLDRMEEKRQRLVRTRRGVGEDMKLISAIGSRPKATPELVRLGVRIAAETGCDGLSIGHYEGTTFECLDAIGDGLRQAGVAVAAGP